LVKIIEKSFRMLKKNSKRQTRNRFDSRLRAQNLAQLINEKKGEDIVIFDLKNLSPITDYFVIANGLSDIHIRAIADHLMEYEKPDHVEGLEATSWILLDFFDVIVHVFSKETRQFYGLERLWGDAQIIEIKDD